jgi:hypothetical protein
MVIVTRFQQKAEEIFFNSLEDCQLSYVNCCGMSEPTANKVDCFLLLSSHWPVSVRDKLPPTLRVPCTHHRAVNRSKGLTHRPIRVLLCKHVWYLYCGRTIHRYGIYGSIVVDFDKKITAVSIRFSFRIDREPKCLSCKSMANKSKLHSWRN